jgi:HAD domain in Swiss Army Knife RNA repair proteins
VLIFLDFDGVLRRKASPPMVFDAECLACFEIAVREIPKARIVISSSWRDLESLSEIRARFSPDVALRIIGMVGYVLTSDDFPRHREVLAYLKNEGLEGQPWVAVEDDPVAYPAGAPVLMTDPDRGFDEEAARRLLELAKRE